MPVAEAVATQSLAQRMLIEFETQAPITRKFGFRPPGGDVHFRSPTKNP